MFKYILILSSLLLSMIMSSSSYAIFEINSKFPTQTAPTYDQAKAFAAQAKKAAQDAEAKAQSSQNKEDRQAADSLKKEYEKSQQLADSLKPVDKPAKK